MKRKYEVEEFTTWYRIFYWDEKGFEVFVVQQIRVKEIAELICKLLNNHAETQEYSKP